jgi:hypothetical protein
MSLIDAIARAAVHKAIINLLTPQKLIDMEEVIVSKIAESGLVGNTVHSMLQTMKAGLMEMTAKEDKDDMEVPS